MDRITENEIEKFIIDLFEKLGAKTSTGIARQEVDMCQYCQMRNGGMNVTG